MSIAEIPPIPKEFVTKPQPRASGSDPYRGVVMVLLVAAILGAAGATYATNLLPNPLLLDAAVAFGIAAGVLTGVAVAQAARARPPKSKDPAPEPASDAEPISNLDSHEEQRVSAALAARLRVLRLIRVPSLPSLSVIDVIRLGTALAGIIAIFARLRRTVPDVVPTPLSAAIAAAVCLVAAGLAATAARYFGDIDPARLPEGPGLCRGARVIGWVLVLTGLTFGLAWAGLFTIVRVFHFLVIAILTWTCFGLFRARQFQDAAPLEFPLDLSALTILGGRPNIFASILDSAEAQLGIDLRSTWALTVVRRSLEPLAIGLCILAWFSTALTVVGVEEQGLVERFGVPLGGEPLAAGLHLHWPWPVDRVSRIPVKRVQTLAVGHEGEVEGKGPENVLWAVEHAPSEYTLLLGNGRDLITVDATVHFRIADARAWRYHSQNPAEALRAIAYRAVMRNTVNRTLAEALSENVAALTARMRGMVQQDADALGLGVEVMAFTVGGMHPPVIVASDYQAVVSAELAKVTAVVTAQMFRNQTVPLAETAVVTSLNSARSQAAANLAQAAGQAWSFRALESQFRAAPEEYFFRRRLETLEKNLPGRLFTIVDFRFQRDGGELWLTP